MTDQGDDGPGSRILLHSGGLDRGARLCRGVPGMAACRGTARLIILGTCARLRTGIQIEDIGGTQIVLARVPPFAHSVVTGYRLSRKDDRPQRHAPADGGASVMHERNASQQLGTALGLATFSAIATSRTTALLTAHAPPAAALTAGFRGALLACAVFLLGAAVIGMRAANSHGEPVIRTAGTHAAREQVPAPELAD